MKLDLASQTLSPLPDVLSHGLVAVSTFGLLSFFCSTSLFFFLTWRLITWRLKSGPNNTPNQFLLLIYNLLLADIQQALAFLLNISALHNNGIFVGTPTCFAQGWFVSTGDLASGVFICAIACHTWMGVVKEYRLPTPAFYCCIGTLWFFVYAMAAIGPIVHGRDFYVRASAWVCSLLSLRPPFSSLTESVLDQRRLPNRASMAALLLDLLLHVQHRPHIPLHLRLPAQESLLLKRQVQVPTRARRYAPHGSLPAHLHSLHRSLSSRPYLRARRARRLTRLFLRGWHDDRM